MPYVLRDACGQIDRIHRNEVPGAEFLPPEHPELFEMLGGPARGASFSHLDSGLIRVLEDLVDVLVRHNVICITDLPVEAQHKLFARKNFRDRFRRNALHLGTPDTPDTLDTGLGDDALIPMVAPPVESISPAGVRNRR